MANWNEKPHVAPVVNVKAMIEARSIPEPNTGCWLWLPAIGRDGYGRISIAGRSRLAHRASWESHVSAIPAGLVIDHKCRVRSCVNPAHLRVTTISDNVRCGEGPTGQHLRATHCIRGHAFDPTNTYRYKKTGWRMCRTCQRERYKGGAAMSTVNVNLCAASPVLIPCPIPRSVTFTVTLGECSLDCGGATESGLARHLQSCPARPIRVACSISGETWPASEVFTCDNVERTDGLFPAHIRIETVLAVCRERWGIVKSAVLGHRLDDTRFDAALMLPLVAKRDAMFSALADMARAEEAAVVAQQALFPFKLRTPGVGHWTRPEDRPSAAFLAAYVEHLVEQVGIL